MSAHSGKRSATELKAEDEMEMPAAVTYGHDSSSNYSIQFRNVRNNSLKMTERNYSEKSILSRRTFRSSSRKTIGSASADLSSTPSKSNDYHASHGDTNFPVSSSIPSDKMESASNGRQEMITSESLPLTNATEITSFECENRELQNMKGYSIDSSRASGSSSTPVHSHKYTNQQQYKASHSHLSLRSRTSTLKDNAQTFSFKNLDFTSTSDILSSSSRVDRKYDSADSLRARFRADGRSSHRGIDVTQSSARNYSLSSQNLHVPHQSSAGQLATQENTRSIRHHPANSDRSAVSVRTRRASSRESRMRSELRDQITYSVSEPVPQVLLTQLAFSESVNARSVQTPVNTGVVQASVNARSVQTPVNTGVVQASVNTRSLQTSLEEPTPGQSSTGNSIPIRVYTDDRITSSTYSHGPMRDSHGYQHFAMAEITEVLLALERIELTRQQLLSLESNSFFGSLLHDQHRSMRMNIDNMTYEELLALEEKMGTVSTALSEEMLSKCIRKLVYNHIPLEIQGCSSGDIKCSICQEEYCAGNEVGMLACGHLYHVGCIQQWLRMKNWCPVCKADAAASSSNLNDP